MTRALTLDAKGEDGIAPGILAGIIRIGLRPLQAFIAEPSVLFFVALLGMLFCHPDVPVHKLSRFTFGLLVLGVVARALVGRAKVFRLEGASWPMIALTAMALFSLIGRDIDQDTWGVLAAKYVYPFTLFHLAQMVLIEDREVRRFEVFALALLAYLSFTAIAFFIGAHALIFPKFILDPNVGIHIERARGPFLQAVANGMAINMLALLVLHGYRQGKLRGTIARVVLASVPVAILATMTRAVWLSFAGSVLAIVFLARNFRSRIALVATLMIAMAGLAVVVSTSNLGGSLGSRLEDSGPVEFRKAVYAGGWQMFFDRPLLGWGFHQMPSELPKYVGEIHDQVLYPHNTYLEVLVENGLVGFSLYAWLMWELLKLGRRKLSSRSAEGLLDQPFRRLWPVILAVYWINATVVVMSYQFVNGILFSVAGMLAAQRRRAEGAG